MFRVLLTLVVLVFTTISLSAEPIQELVKSKSSESKQKVQLDPIIRKALLRALSELESNETIITDTEAITDEGSDSEILVPGDDKNSATVQLKSQIRYHSYVIDGQKVFHGRNDSKLSALTSNEIEKSATTRKTLAANAFLNELIETNESSNIQQSRSITGNSISSNIAKISNEKVNYNEGTKRTTTSSTTTTTTTTTPKPTHNEDGENIEEVSGKDVQVFQAPLVAAFTVHQDAQGLPKKVVPIVKSPPLNDLPLKSNIKSDDFLTQQINLQKQLEEKQKILEQQLKLLQEQQKQQEELLRQQQLVQVSTSFKPLPNNIAQHIRNDDPKRQSVQSTNSGSLVSIQQSRNIGPLFQTSIQHNDNTITQSSLTTNQNQIRLNQFQENVPFQVNQQGFTPNSLPTLQNHSFQKIQSANQPLLAQNQVQNIQIPLQQNQRLNQQSQQLFQQRTQNIPQLTQFQQLPTPNPTTFLNGGQQLPALNVNQFQNSRSQPNHPSQPQLIQTPQQQNPQGNRGLSVTIQPSLSLESNNNIVNQQLPSREAVDFLLHLRSQRPTQFPLQENHLPPGIGRLPLPAVVQSFIPNAPQTPLNPVNSNFNSGSQNIRVFRQENGASNLGFNNHRNNNNFLPSSQIFNNFHSHNRFVQTRSQGFRIAPDEELQQLLYQSGVSNAPREDLNIVSKVLALNHGVANNNNFRNRRSEENGGA